MSHVHATLEEPAALRPAPASRARSVWLLVFALACGLHLYAWYVHPARPSLTDARITGWYGGSADQINYLLEARALSVGQLPGMHWDYEGRHPRLHPPSGAIPSDYAYGLGYPMLAAPFVRLGLARDPFLVPDTIAFGLIICLALLLARRFLSAAAAIVFAGMLAVASPLLPFTVMPWNTTITVIAVLVSLLFAMSERVDWKAGLALGAVCGLCYAARYTDVVWPLAIVVAGLLRPRAGDVRGRLAAVATAGVVLGVAFLAVGWTQHVVFGNFYTNPYHYHLHNGHAGDSLAEFRLGQIPRAFTEVFVTAHAGPRIVHEPHTSVLRAFPWVAAAPFGLLLLLQRRRRERPVLVAAALASVASSAFYLAYWSGTGTSLEYDNLRFFVPWFPFWGLLAAVAFAELIGHGAAALDDEASPVRTSAPRWWRWCLGAALIPAMLALVAHAAVQAPVLVDLIRQFNDAEKRPPWATFDVGDQRIRGEVKPAISAPAPCRLIWTVTVPDHARLTVALAVGEEAWSRDETFEFRIGISRDNVYSDLLVRRMHPRDVLADRGWLPITIDLEGYAGGRLSLIFNAGTLTPLPPGAPGPKVYWAAPVVSGYAL